MSETEREDLDALVHSDGWRMFRDHVVSEWGTGGHRFLKGVKDAADNTTPGATEQLRQIIVAQREIDRMLGWPDERLKQISKPELVASGGMLSQRRGGL